MNKSHGFERTIETYTMLLDNSTATSPKKNLLMLNLVIVVRYSLKNFLPFFFNLYPRHTPNSAVLLFFSPHLKSSIRKKFAHSSDGFKSRMVVIQNRFHMHCLSVQKYQPTSVSTIVYLENM